MARRLSVLRALPSGVAARVGALAGRLARRRQRSTGPSAVDDPDRPDWALSVSDDEAVRPHGDGRPGPAAAVMRADPASAAPESDRDDSDDPYDLPGYGRPRRPVQGRYTTGSDPDRVQDDAAAADAAGIAPVFDGDPPPGRRRDRLRRLRPLLLGGGVAAVAMATLVALVAALPGTASDPSQAIRDRTLVADLHTTMLRMRDQGRALMGTGAVGAGLRYRRFAADAVDQRDRLRPRLSGIAAREALAALDEAMESQRVAFGALERTIAEIGVGPAEGWHGTVVAAANVLEQSIASIDRDDLMVWFLLMRLHEREFLLTGNPDLVGRVNEAGLNINFEVVRASLPDARRTAVLQRLTDYTNAIASLSDLVQSRAAAQTQMVLHGDRMARPLEVLAAQTDRAMRLATRDAAVTARRSESLAWISALIGAVGCLLLALHIALDVPMRRAPPRPRYAPAAVGPDSDDDPGLWTASHTLMPAGPDADPLLLTTPAGPMAASLPADPSVAVLSTDSLPGDRPPADPSSPASPSPAGPGPAGAEPSSVVAAPEPAPAVNGPPPTGGTGDTPAPTRRLSVRLPAQTIRVVPEPPAHPADQSRTPDQPRTSDRR